MAVYRKRRRRNDSNVDDWLMTYADMITLLLCFFAIFLSISVPKKDQMLKAREQVMQHFASPNEKPGKDFPKHLTGGLPGDLSYDKLPSFIDQFHEGEGNDSSGNQNGSGETPAQQQQTQTIDLSYKPQPKTPPKPLPEGDLIKTIEMPSAAFFASGSATLSPEGAKLLQEILDTKLNSKELEGYQVTVEGHTDDSPISTAQFPSNWELSTGRAAAVVRYFIDHGFPAQRLRVAGYADTFPKVPNRDADGKPIPENQAQNRRVVIKLEKIEKAQ